MEFDNKKKTSNILDILSLFINQTLRLIRYLKRLLIANPDYVYFQNLWFKANTGLLDIAGKLKLQYLVLKIHNFRFECGYYFSSNKHINKNEICPKCGFENKKYTIFNKYFSESYLKSFFVILHNKKLIKKKLKGYSY